MIHPTSLRQSPSSIDVSRSRDLRIRRLLDMHPATAAMLVSIGWFPTKNKALKRLRRLVARKQVRLVGTICRKSGRPEHVYCRWRPKLDQLLHEVQLTELCFRIAAGRILRGPYVTDKAILPDAEVWIGGGVYYLELDRGTMGYGQLERRFRKYETCPHFSLWVCSSIERREAMRRRATAVRSTALFATLADVLASPHGPVWTDFDGAVAALPSA